MGFGIMTRRRARWNPVAQYLAARAEPCASQAAHCLEVTVVRQGNPAA